jgi:hypothetical protein
MGRPMARAAAPGNRGQDRAGRREPPAHRREPVSSIPACCALFALSTLLACSAQAHRITIDRQQFAVTAADGQPSGRRLLLFISYFDALRATDLETDLDYIATVLKFDGLRVLPNWLQRDANYCAMADTDLLFDSAGNVRGDGPQPTGALKRLLDLVEAAGARRLVVDVSFVRNAGISTDAYIRAVTRTVFLLRPFENVIIDLQNEVDVNQLAEADVKRLLDGIRKDDRRRIVMVSRSGAVADAVAYNSRLGMSAVAYHDGRERGSGLRICERTEGVNRESDGDPERFRTAVANAKSAGAAAWTFHTRQSFRLDSGGSLRSRIEANAAEKMLLEGTADTPSLAAIPRGRRE